MAVEDDARVHRKACDNERACCMEVCSLNLSTPTVRRGVGAITMAGLLTQDAADEAELALLAGIYSQNREPPCPGLLLVFEQAIILAQEALKAMSTPSFQYGIRWAIIEQLEKGPHTSLNNARTSS